MIVLSASQRAQILTAAERAYPDECCGLLVGREGEDGRLLVSRVVESENVHPDRTRDRFEVDPRIRIALERELRDAPERIVGHYHSHPDHPAQPSATDLELAFEPSLVWLIVGVADGRADRINAFCIDEARGAFVAIEMV